MKRLASDLEREEVVAWIDTMEIDVGDSIVRRISQALNEHDYFVPVLSPDYVISNWCKKELSVGVFQELERKTTVLPVLYRKCEIPVLICDKLYADFSYMYQFGFLSLLRSLRIARKNESQLPIHQEILIGKLKCRHNTSHSVKVINQDGIVSYHPVTFTRSDSNNEGPDPHDFSIEFDVTSYASMELRITGIDVEVRAWKPIEPILGGEVCLGLNYKRLFYCHIGKNIGAYSCQFEIPKGYVILSEREMEVVRVQVNTFDEGIYDLAVSINYSVAGQEKTISTETINGIWFISKPSYLRAIESSHRRAVLSSKT